MFFNAFVELKSDVSFCSISNFPCKFIMAVVEMKWRRDQTFDRVVNPLMEILKKVPNNVEAHKLVVEIFIYLAYHNKEPVDILGTLENVVSNSSDNRLVKRHIVEKLMRIYNAIRYEDIQDRVKEMIYKFGMETVADLPQVDAEEPAVSTNSVVLEDKNEWEV
jgi:hypothetical protein